MNYLRNHAFLVSYLVMVVLVVSLYFIRWHDEDSSAQKRQRIVTQICASQKQTVTSVTNAFEEFKKTVLLSYEQFPPDPVRRARDAAFFNAVLKVLEPPNC